LNVLPNAQKTKAGSRDTAVARCDLILIGPSLLF
jgi:hypothetical protein